MPCGRLGSVRSCRLSAEHDLGAMYHATIFTSLWVRRLIPILIGNTTGCYTTATNMNHNLPNQVGSMIFLFSETLGFDLPVSTRRPSPRASVNVTAPAFMEYFNWVHHRNEHERTTCLTRSVSGCHLPSPGRGRSNPHWRQRTRAVCWESGDSICHTWVLRSPTFLRCSSGPGCPGRHACGGDIRALDWRRAPRPALIAANVAVRRRPRPRCPAGSVYARVDLVCS